MPSPDVVPKRNNRIFKMAQYIFKFMTVFYLCRSFKALRLGMSILKLTGEVLGYECGVTV